MPTVRPTRINSAASASSSSCWPSDHAVTKLRLTAHHLDTGLNRRIFERLSVRSPGQDPLSIPFYVTSTTFKTDEYGECAKLFKQRLGLEGAQDLFVLRNVVMCPFSTSYGFLRQLTDSFQKLLEEEVEVSSDLFFKCSC